MENFDKAIEKAMRAINDAANAVESNESLKEYLIEGGYWNEDYTATVNAIEYIYNAVLEGRA